MRKIFAVSAFFFLLAGTASAQTHPAPAAAGQPQDRQPIVLGVTDRLKSAELGETRSFNIYLPKGYNVNSDTSYPVIYLLDGGVDEDFIHIAGIAQFLSGIVDTMPKCIIVGITNVDRMRDFTFPGTDPKDNKMYPKSGGSTKFISFIEKELQPYIEKKYKAGKYKTLIGQSLGGLLASQILMEKPDLFTDYLIVSPSLWWSNESFLIKSATLVKSFPDTKHHVVFATGAEGDQMSNDAKKLASILQNAGKKLLKVDYLDMPAETHLTILHNAAYQGFEILFAHQK